MFISPRGKQPSQRLVLLEIITLVKEKLLLLPINDRQCFSQAMR